MLVSLKEHNNYTELWLNDPSHLNAIGTDLAKELLTALHSEKLRQSKCIVMRTKSVKAKDKTIGVAGGNLKQLANLKRHEAFVYSQTMNEVCRIIEKTPKPFLFAADGDLIGGGAELVLPFDVRIATSNVTLVFKQLDIGLSMGYGNAYRFVTLVGKAKAQSILYSNQTLGVEEAQALGIWHEVIDEKSLKDATIQTTVDRILSFGAEAFQTQKAMFNLSQPELERETHLFASIWKNPKHLKMLKKFLERKK